MGGIHGIGGTLSAAVPFGGCDEVEGKTLVLPAEVCLSLLEQADRIQRAGLKSFGLFVSDPDQPGYPFMPSGVVVFDPQRNRRNDRRHRAAFHAQGDYFRRYDDAGFVADPADLLRAYRQIDDAGLEIVGMFHSHRRQPPNFSTIDFRLHNPAFPWHLILSYHHSERPELAAFRVQKPDMEMGIGEHDDRQGSELTYRGPEVSSLTIAVQGDTKQVESCLVAV